MLQKFLLFTFLALIFCSPLWAEEDNPWEEILSYKANQAEEPTFASVSTGLDENQIASPQTFCATNPFATSCIPTCGIGPFPGGYLWRYQNPELVCPAPVYPFEVTQISIGLTNCGPAPCTLLFEGGIYKVGPGLDSCPDGFHICLTPGELICPSKTVSVILRPLMSACTTIVLDLIDTCCVYQPYFAGVKFPCPNPCFVNPCFDNSSDTCKGSWWWDCINTDTLNTICDLGFQKNLCINSYGYVSDQNHCPNDNRGIDTVYFTPGIFSGEFITHVVFYIEADSPLVNKNYSCNFELYIDGQLIETKPETVYYEPTSGSATASIIRCTGFHPNCTHEECGTALGVPLTCEPIDRFGRPCDCRTTVYVDISPFPYSKPPVPSLPSELRLVPVEIPCPPVICDPPPIFIQENYNADDAYSTMFNLPGCTARPGDMNGDYKFNLPDIIGLVNFVFKGAQPPNPNCRANTNGDSMTNLTDIIYLVNTVFKGGPKPRTVGECCL